MSHLARFLLLQPQNTTDLVDRLERRQLVRRIRDDTDRRVVLVEITDAGREILKEIGAVAWSVGVEALGAIDEQELADLTESLRRIRGIAAVAGGVPAEHLAYAEERLAITPLFSGNDGAAAD